MRSDDNDLYLDRMYVLSKSVNKYTLHISAFIGCKFYIKMKNIINSITVNYIHTEIFKGKP